MDMQASVDRVTIQMKMVSFLITPKDKEKLVKVLTVLLKKAKPDRYEESIVKDFLSTLEEAKEKPIESKKPEVEETIIEKVVEKAPEIVVTKSKKQMVAEIKSRVDTKNEKPLPVFIKESIDFGKAQFHISTEPKNLSEEAFFDWLLENRIINADGSPAKR